MTITEKLDELKKTDLNSKRGLALIDSLRVAVEALEKSADENVKPNTYNKQSVAFNALVTIKAKLGAK